MHSGESTMKILTAQRFMHAALVPVFFAWALPTSAHIESEPLKAHASAPSVQAYIVNLDEDDQRREHSIELLDKIGIAHEIVSAIRPNASVVGRLRNQGTLKLLSDFQSYSELVSVLTALYILADSNFGRFSVFGPEMMVMISTAAGDMV
eukprot:m.166172 g.166172  ORF g.166172 m.166172 type:complete len:150 (-) comp18149_c0_seq1:981-1430(-)